MAPRHLNPKTTALLRPWPLGVPLVLALGPGAALAQAPVAPGPRPFLLTYEAPPECPDRAAFVTLVSQRVGPGWEAPPGVGLSPLVVRLTHEEARFAARFTLEDERGNLSRAVVADTCPEVANGIALVTVLAIESRIAPPPTDAASVVLPADAASQVGTPAPPAPPPAPPARPPPAPPLRRSDDGADESSPPPHVDIGAGALGTFGVGPELALGPRGFFGVGWEGGPDFRLSLDFASTGQTESDTQFSLLAGVLSGCPVAVEPWSGFRALPCAGVAVGVLQAVGDGNATYQGDRRAPGWAALLASLRADATFQVVFVEVGAESRFFFGDRTFEIFRDGPNRRIYKVPWAAFGFSFGVGLRL